MTLVRVLGYFRSISLGIWDDSAVTTANFLAGETPPHWVSVRLEPSKWPGFPVFCCYIPQPCLDCIPKAGDDWSFMATSDSLCRFWSGLNMINLMLCWARQKTGKITVSDGAVCVCKKLLFKGLPFQPLSWGYNKKITHQFRWYHHPHMSVLLNFLLGAMQLFHERLRRLCLDGDGKTCRGHWFIPANTKKRQTNSKCALISRLNWFNHLTIDPKFRQELADKSWQRDKIPPTLSRCVLNVWPTQTVEVRLSCLVPKCPLLLYSYCLTIIFGAQKQPLWLP